MGGAGIEVEKVSLVQIPLRQQYVGKRSKIERFSPPPKEPCKRMEGEWAKYASNNQSQTSEDQLSRRW